MPPETNQSPHKPSELPSRLAFDFEADIISHTISKKSTTTEKQASSNKEYYSACIPLSVEDIPKIQIEMGRFSVFGVYSKYVAIYGHMEPEKINRKDERIYYLDDGTGRVQVIHKCNEARKICDKVSQLSSEVMHIKRNGYKQWGALYTNPESETCKNFIGCLEMLLRKIGEQSYTPEEFYPIGSKAAVIASPYKMPNGDIVLYAHEINLDNGPDRNKEILFKQFLIEKYKNTYRMNS